MYVKINSPKCRHEKWLSGIFNEMLTHICGLLLVSKTPVKWRSVAYWQSSRLWCSRSPVQVIFQKSTSNPGKGRVLCRAYSVLYQDGTLLQRQGVLDQCSEHFPITNAASQWLYVNSVCRFHKQVFSVHTSFLLHLKIRIYFWPISRCVYKACSAALGLITYMCTAAVTQWHLGNPFPLGCKLHFTKTANYYYLYYYCELNQLIQTLSGNM